MNTLALFWMLFLGCIAPGTAFWWGCGCCGGCGGGGGWAYMPGSVSYMRKPVYGIVRTPVSYVRPMPVQESYAIAAPPRRSYVMPPPPEPTYRMPPPTSSYVSAPVAPPRLYPEVPPPPSPSASYMPEPAASSYAEAPVASPFGASSLYRRYLLARRSRVWA